MATKMQQRRGTEQQWTIADPVLASGEIGFENDTNKFKIGDGVNQWNDLDYFVNLDGLGDQPPPLAVNDIARINGWADNTIEPKDRGFLSSSSSLASGSMHITAFTPAANITVSQITMASNGKQSGVTFTRMGLYEFTGAGLNSGTLLARTAVDTTLFTANTTVYTRSFDTTDGYPDSVTLVAGTRYGIALLASATAIGSKVIYATVSNVMTTTLPWVGSTSTQTDLPATFTAGTKTPIHVWGKLS
jgi:hypothetical protein